MSFPWQIAGPYGKPLLFMQPNAIDAQPIALARQGDEIATPHGARIIDTGPAPAIARHEVEFALKSRSEIAFLEGFFDARQGKAQGFWFPRWSTWDFDVRGYEEPNAGSFDLWVTRTGYVEQVFPLGLAYRQIMLLWRDLYHTFTIADVTGNVSPGIDALHLSGNGDGSVGTIPTTLFHVVPPSDAHRVLWLSWGRFDQDELVADELGEGGARIALSLLELPAEAPTA
jgi:hypothetical protein